MSRNREETVIIHAIASETALRVGYPATVSVYQRDGAHHYAASVGLTDEPNGSKRARGHGALPPGRSGLPDRQRGDGRRLALHRRPLAGPEGGR